MVEAFSEYALRSFDCDSVLIGLDRRWFCSKDVPTGFSIVRTTKPQYHWFSKGTCYDKVNFRRDGFSDYDGRMTFIENMNSHGFFRYYDCGKYVCQKKRPPLP